jgi:cardiolipin synthase
MSVSEVAILAVRISRALTARQCAEAASILRREQNLIDVVGPLERRFGPQPWIAEVANTDYSPSYIAEILDVASQSRQDERSASHVEFVWTGPTTNQVEAQATEHVFLELITGADKRLIVVTYAAREVETVLGALEEAARRGVAVIVVCETQLHGAPFNERVLKRLHQIPSLQVYGWMDRQDGSSLHAKIVVADGQRALVTSANLTQAAMQRNIEAGVLLEGGTVPARIEAHVLELVANAHFLSI